MNVLDGDVPTQEQRADRVGESIGALPAAPMVMPKQVLEQPVRLRARLGALLGAGIRARRLGP